MTYHDKVITILKILLFSAAVFLPIIFLTVNNGEASNKLIKTERQDDGFAPLPNDLAFQPTQEGDTVHARATSPSDVSPELLTSQTNSECLSSTTQSTLPEPSDSTESDTSSIKTDETGPSAPPVQSNPAEPLTPTVSLSPTQPPMPNSTSNELSEMPPTDTQEKATGTEESQDAGSAADNPAEEGSTDTKTDRPPYVAPDPSTFPEPDKIAYITIDDGPSREVTPGILDLLKQEGIKATFFVLPHSGVMDIYQRIIDEGHELGNHSYTHDYKKLYKANDLETFEEDILLAREFIQDNFGYTTTIFRFPGGAMSWKAKIIDPRREFLAEEGYRDFDWSVDTGDANSKQKDKSPEALTERVLDNTRSRDKLIVLMHDTKSKTTTLEALPRIIAGLRLQGYDFDTLRNY